MIKKKIETEINVKFNLKMSGKIAIVFHARPYAKLGPGQSGAVDDKGMSSFTTIPERIYQIEFRKVGGDQCCLIWDRVTGEKVKFHDIEFQREQCWSTLPESTTQEEKVAYWIVELYKQSADSMLEEIQETVKLFVEVLRTIRDDTTVTTPETMSDPAPRSPFDYEDMYDYEEEEGPYGSFCPRGRGPKSILDVISE